MEEVFASDLLFPLEWLLHTEHLRVLNLAVDAPADPFTQCKSFCCKAMFVCLCFRGRYVVALGRSWHPEEFTCCQCKRVLDEGGFFEEKGSIYCTKCYDNRYSPNCAKCKKIITGVTAFPTVLQHNYTMQLLIDSKWVVEKFIKSLRMLGSVFDTLPLQSSGSV